MIERAENYVAVYFIPRATAPAHYLVVDLEATCSDDESVPKHQMEIIEIGAATVNAEALEPVGEHQTFVRPVRHPKLTAACTKLASIRQHDVDAAAGLRVKLTVS